MPSEGEMLHTVCVKGFYHEFIKSYGSMSYTEGVMGFRIKSIYFVLE